VSLSIAFSGCAQVPPQATADGSPEVSPSPSETLEIQAQDADILMDRNGLVTATGFATDEARGVWTERMLALNSALSEVRLGDLAQDWDGDIAVKLPADAAAFLAKTGKAADSFAAATACEAGKSQVYISPEIPDDDPDGIAAVLLHESVHVMTNSPCGEPGPQWISEGIAESVTASVYSFVAGENEELVRAYLADNDVPKTLPDLDAPAGVAGQLGVALSQYAVNAAIEELGRDKALKMLGGLAKQEAVAAAAKPESQKQLKDLTSWYLRLVKGLK
jgi:hypothetical protein